MAGPATAPRAQTGPPRTTGPAGSRVERGYNAVIASLLRLGAPLGPMALLTVAGRISGKPRSTPVAVVPFEDGWRVCAPFGVVNWVKNLRAAGEGTLTYRGATSRFSAVELPLREAAPLLRATIADAGGLTRKMLAPHFAASPDDTDEAWVTEARGKPVFHLVPTRLRTSRGDPLLRTLVAVLIVGIVAQVVLAGLGAFGYAGGWAWHRTGGVVVEAIALVAALLAIALRRAGARWLTVGILTLIAFQHGTSAIGGLAGALHALNAVVILGMAVVIRRRLRYPGSSPARSG